MSKQGDEKVVKNVMSVEEKQEKLFNTLGIDMPDKDQFEKLAKYMKGKMSIGQYALMAYAQEASRDDLLSGHALLKNMGLMVSSAPIDEINALTTQLESVKVALLAGGIDEESQVFIDATKTTQAKIDKLNNESVTNIDKLNMLSLVTIGKKSSKKNPSFTKAEIIGHDLLVKEGSHRVLFRHTSMIAQKVIDTLKIKDVDNSWVGYHLENLAFIKKSIDSPIPHKLAHVTAGKINHTKAAIVVEYTPRHTKTFPLSALVEKATCLLTGQINKAAFKKLGDEQKAEYKAKHGVEGISRSAWQNMSLISAEDSAKFFAGRVIKTQDGLEESTS